MKRVGIILGFMVMLGTGSCTRFSGKTGLRTDIDSLSFFYGLMRTEGIMNYLTTQAGVDSSYMDAFFKGFSEGSKHYSPENVAYYEGVRIAHLINNQWVRGLNNEIFMGDSGQSVNRHAMLSGFYNGVKNPDEMRVMHAQTFTSMKLESVKENYRQTKYADLIIESENFLNGNKSRPGVKTTESGLQYKIIVEGDGAIPGDRARVKVNYRGVLIDGTEFDSSYKNNTPSTFYVLQLVKGWTEALKMMPVGSKWELYIPPGLGYGSAGSPPTIPPYATLIFELELLEIVSN